LAFQSINERKSMTPEITLPVAELKQALPGFSKIVSKSRTFPVLQSVRVQRDAQGVVTLEGTDLDAHLAYRLKDTQAGKPVAVLVPFDSLTKTAKGSSETLTLIPDGKDKLRLRYQIGNSPVEQRISCYEMNEWPPAPKLTAPAVALDPDFGATLKEALQCASDDASRPVLKGACLDVTDPEGHYVVGTNGRILFAANSFSFDLKQSVIIPNSKFLLWNGFDTEAGCQFVVQNDPKDKELGWVQLQTPRWTYTTRKIAGDYPNWKQAVPTPSAQGTTLKLSAEAVTQILEVAPQLPGGDDVNRPVRLFVEAGELQLAGRPRNDPAWTRVQIDGVAITGPDIEASLNREFLVQALRYGLNQINLETPDDVVLFSAGGRKCVVKLLSSPPTAAPAPASTNPPQPTEAAAATPPSVAASEPTPTEPRNNMSQSTVIPPRRGNLQPKVEGTNGHGNHNAPNGSALTAAVTQIETVKTALRDVMLDLNATLDLLRAAEKEKKASFKEVESVRATLRSLQKVAI
jgi:DNA polymerase III sliding clamp (beta) subunit (PCNA family)